MAKRISFTKHERAILPAFRRRISVAESLADVSRQFALAAGEMIDLAFAGGLELGCDDLAFAPGAPPHFRVGERLLAQPDFALIWRESDLPRTLGRLAETAHHHWRHMQRHPQRTDLKIREGAR